MLGRKRQRLCIAVLLGVALLVFPLMPSMVRAAVALISIPSVETSGTVTLPINIDGVTDLGAVTIWLSYNKDVVEVNSVADGDMGAVVSNIDNSNGVTKMTWFNGGGKTGDFIFAYITMSAVGDLGSSSILDLDVKEFVDTSLVPIAHDVDDGLFTIITGSTGIMAGSLLTRTVVPIAYVALICISMVYVISREPKIVGLVLLAVAVYIGLSFLGGIQEAINLLPTP